jgi:hypothetical protein
MTNSIELTKKNTKKYKKLILVLIPEQYAIITEVIFLNLIVLYH